MKKVLSIILVILMSVSMAGCGGSGGPSESTAAEAYENSKVSYLGPEGTYTQEACELHFGNKGEYLPYETVEQAVQALADGETDFAVIPQENTIGGAVIDYVDVLINTEGVSVVGEVELPISQNLLVAPAADLEDIKTVYSHKQGIAQGKEWMEKNLPDAEIIEVSSTAEGAKMVSESAGKSFAAIASAGCAEVYGLEILAAGIQNNDSNVTRFYVLSQEEPSKEELGRIAFVATGSAEMLPSLMEGFAKRGITLVAIHDRPQKTELGEYHYLIECEDISYEDYEELVDGSSFEFRYLGSF